MRALDPVQHVDSVHRQLLAGRRAGTTAVLHRATQHPRQDIREPSVGSDARPHGVADLPAQRRLCEIGVDLGREIGAVGIGDGFAQVAEGRDEVGLAVDQHEAARIEAAEKLLADGVGEARAGDVDRDGMARHHGIELRPERDVAGDGRKIGRHADWIRLQVAVAGDGNAGRSQQMKSVFRMGIADDRAMGEAPEEAVVDAEAKLALPRRGQRRYAGLKRGPHRPAARQPVVNGVGGKRRQGRVGMVGGRLIEMTDEGDVSCLTGFRWAKARCRQGRRHLLNRRRRDQAEIAHEHTLAAVARPGDDPVVDKRALQARHDAIAGIGRSCRMGCQQLLGKLERRMIPRPQGRNSQDVGEEVGLPAVALRRQTAHQRLREIGQAEGEIGTKAPEILDEVGDAAGIRGQEGVDRNLEDRCAEVDEGLPAKLVGGGGYTVKPRFRRRRDGNP